MKIEAEGHEYDGLPIVVQRVDSVRLADLHREIMQKVIEKQMKEEMDEKERATKSGSRVRGGPAYRIYRRLQSLQQNVLTRLAERDFHAAAEHEEERRILKVKSRAAVLNETLTQKFTLAQRLAYSNQVSESRVKITICF